MVQVIFADGTFIDGSTSELSCDGPLREPYAVFCQVHVSSSLALVMNNLFPYKRDVSTTYLCDPMAENEPCLLTIRRVLI